jgi:hypothetical protein
MDTERAKRFLEAAQEDYERRLSFFVLLVEGLAGAEADAITARGVWEEEDAERAQLREARADVLAARQVLELAQQEVERAPKGGERWLW